MMRRLLILSFLMAMAGLSAQDASVKVRGQFLTDSIKIGKPFPYALAAEYPSNVRILFPDSTFSFEPFEYAGKEFFPTQSANGISRDSAIYYLNSFEIDSVQSLALPVFVVQGGDSLRRLPTLDQVWLQRLVTLNTDSIQANNLPLKVNAFYEPVSWLFNYPLAGIIGAVAIVLLVVAWLIFGKRILLYFKAKRLRKSFEDYIRTFSDSVDQLKVNYTASAAERVLTLWKKYLEHLEEKPFTKLSSKEIVRASGHETLAAPLATVDKLVYAGLLPTSFDAFYELKSYSEDRFFQKLQEINQSGK